jgi:hypothetical protein
MKILDPAIDDYYLSFKDFFDLNNPGQYEYLTNSYSGPVDILLQNHIAWQPNVLDNYNYKILLFLDTRHNHENQIKYQRNRQGNRYFITNAIDPTVNDEPNILFNDYLFNRTKAYYSGYEFSSSDVWYFCCRAEYTIPDKHDPLLKNKIFVAPTNVRNFATPGAGGHQIYRNRLKNFLKNNYLDIGYLGSPRDTSVGELICNTIDHTGGGYRPPANTYYEDSFISIYGETIEHGTTFAATEKTFDPLIKGHFILPFSNYKFINFIKQQYGFRFPDFIDYSYDNIESDNLRYLRYCDEVDRLMTIDIDAWRQLWIDNIDLIKHNRQIFFDRPYHRTDITSLLI